MQPLLALLVTFGLMYVLLIRPQQRRMRQHQAVVSSLRAGDEIVTAGGIYGTVLSVDDETMVLEVAPGVELRVLRAAVSQRVTVDDDMDDDDMDDDEDDSGFIEGDAIAGDHPELSPADENGRAGVAEPAKKEEEN
ncbi:MAG: preprotein translocase subunit YajC [Acidimicrobiales bacterium]